MRAIAGVAIAKGYGVPGINIFDDVTMGALFAGDFEAHSRSRANVCRDDLVYGAEVLVMLWKSVTAGVEVPVSLHLNHSLDRKGDDEVSRERLELDPLRCLVSGG